MHQTHRDVHPTLGYIAIDVPALCRTIADAPLPFTVLHEAIEAIGGHHFERDLIRTVRHVVGMPYRPNAATCERPRTFDCSSLIKWTFAQVGIWLPRFTHLMVNHGEQCSRDDVQPGDLLFTPGSKPWRHAAYAEGIGHVAIVTVPGSCVHTDNTQTKRVVEVSIASLVHDIVAVRRIIPNPCYCTVVRLPRTLLHITTAEELTACIRSELQKHRHLRS